MRHSLLYPDSDLSEQLLGHAERIRAFAREKLLPHARSVDEERKFRPETVAELAEAGILGGPIAAEHGGGGWSPLELVVAHEEIGAVCGNTRGFLAVQGGLVAGCIQAFGSDAQKATYLPQLTRGEIIGCFALTEPEAGSDIASLRCSADLQGDHYVLRGEKIWITNGGIAQLAIVFCTVDPRAGRDGLTAFLLDTSTRGLLREPMPGIELGHRGSDHARLVLDGVKVPRDSVLGGVGGGFATAMGGLSNGRLSVASGAVGIQRAALAHAIDFVVQRHQFGKPLSSFQMVQERIADMTVEMLAARELVHRCARRRMRGIEDPGDLAAAKLFATEAATRAAEQAIMLFGGRGYSSEYPVERLLRDAMGLKIYEGTSMIQKVIVAKSILKDG